MYTFIINPASRSGSGAAVWRQLEPVLKDRQIPYEAFFTRYQRHAVRLARDITGDGAPHTLIVLGGDGTINEVINGIQNISGTVLGYIPSGSGNDFARAFHLPCDPAGALELVLQPPAVTAIDIGCLSYQNHTRRFAVSTGLGFDAAICHQAVISRLKPVLNRLHLGKLTYALIALDRLHYLRPADGTVTLDTGEVLPFSSLLFTAVMNLPCEGGGFFFCPGADPCDRQLDLVIASGISRLRALCLLPLALKGAHKGKKGILLRKCRRAVIETSSALPVHTDGEPVFLQKKIELSLLDEQLRIMVPHPVRQP